MSVEVVNFDVDGEKVDGEELKLNDVVVLDDVVGVEFCKWFSDDVFVGKFKEVKLSNRLVSFFAFIFGYEFEVMRRYRMV